ncbi:9b4528e5-c3d6-4de2-a521-ac7d14acd17b [Sclerotinia trifoliorum]|uniref:9b4528e5-c3d6-4de2-a521-ac7d14acd17b n=1 Tax=Sclerotinia trifoliorum TaxID=28548 RepID=A0A8H2ZJV7_9HELO|nr:9b4528e5-c3d6-4de2-a521-ac7d14acd17b [Sclerotinia trifoliorum]
MATSTASSSDNDSYSEHHRKFQSTPVPQTEKEWLSRASEISQIFGQDAAKRDIENKSPGDEVLLLKSSGLLKLLGPKQYGGGGQSWDVAYKAIREVAKGDGSLGMLLGYHLLWSTTANIVGTDEQKDRLQKHIIENNFFMGGAVNPRDSDLSIKSDGDNIVFNGQKHFNTGGVVSDMTILEGVLEGTGKHIFAAVPTRQPGIKFAHNWNNIGLRLTESGSVKIENVRVPWADALGWDAQTKEPLPEILNVPFATLLLPTIQLVFANFYIGISLGAIESAAKYTTTYTRAWPFGGDNKDSPTEEWYILERYGTFHAHLSAVVALADSTGEKVAAVYAEHQEKRSVSARERGELAEAVAAVKVVATDVGLKVTSGVFEMTGARATSKNVGLDRFWRDIRTHSLHDPVAYKKRELGRWALLGEIPEPTWYT